MAQVRQLASIMFADIQGYSALMQEDEAKAQVTRDKFQQVLENTLPARRGRIVQFLGDGALCLFNSAVDAVEAAIEIQRHMQEEPKVPLRIGIHSGDVVVDETNVVGNGVNMAGRLESFAVPGSILISDTVFNDISNHPDITTFSLGQYKFKNIENPVEIFAISNPGMKVPSRKNLKGKGEAFSGKRKWIAIPAAIILLAVAVFSYFKFINPGKKAVFEKSIAVLPFTNMSGNKEDEYLSDGITEDIITNLATIADLNPTSRTSVMQYKGTKKNIRQIADELGVVYVLEGSVQHEGDKIRITAQLINAKEDKHQWAESWDKDFQDRLSVQTEIAQIIAAQLNAKISQQEKEQINKKEKGNTDAYNLVQQAKYIRSKSEGNPQEIKKVMTLLNQALMLDSNDVRVWTEIAFTHLTRSYSRNDNRDEAISATRKATDKAYSLDKSSTEVYRLRGTIKTTYDYDWKGANAEYQKAFALEPGNSLNISVLAFLNLALGRTKESIELSRKAMKLDPVSITHPYNLSMALLFSGQANEAEAVLKKALELHPDNNDYNAQLGRIYLLAGKPDSALYFIQQKNKDSLYMIVTLPLIYYSKGNKIESEKTLQDLIKKFADMAAFQVAEIYAWRGEKDKAFEWLEKAYANHDGGITQLKNNPFLKILFKDPRWTVFLKKVGLE
ncbi:MAG: tetratricopeptide repeat protein [Chitinophagaceae bacterium]